MIVDIDNGIENSLLPSFADDTRWMKRIAKLVDISLMQEDLNSVYDWTDQSNSELNGTKFECARYGMNAEFKENTYYLTPEGTGIKCKDQVKDLGVIMYNDCTFNSHITSVVSCQIIKLVDP